MPYQELEPEEGLGVITRATGEVFGTRHYRIRRHRQVISDGRGGLLDGMETLDLTLGLTAEDLFALDDQHEHLLSTEKDRVLRFVVRAGGATITCGWVRS